MTSLGAPVGVGDVVVSDEHAGLKTREENNV